jgi:Tol biopolymer transport system component
MDQLEAAPIRGAIDTPFEPVFSPDGQWVAYHSGTQLKKIAVTGGAPTTICDAQAPWGASWDGDRIVFGEGGAGIFEVPATGGTPKLLIVADAKKGEFLHGPQVLPGGQAVLFTIGSAGTVIDRWSSAQVAVQSLKTGERRVLVSGGTDARYLPTGHIVYARDGVMFANAFDVARLELRGGPTAVVEGVARSAGGLTGAVHFGVSDAGTIAYMPAGIGAVTMLAWRNRDGSDVSIGTPPHTYETPRVSPDGTRIALHAADQDNDIWIWDVKSETLTRLTFDKAQDNSPVWTRDGKRVIYTSGTDGAPNLFWKPADGTGAPERLLSKAPESNGALVANSVTPDGKQLIYSVGVPADVMALTLDGGDRQPRPLMAQPAFAERGGDVSPDGKWIVYYSDESGTFQVYVRPFPDVNSGRWQVSGDGGILPKWSPSGREILYIDARSRLASVSVLPGATFAFGKTAGVFDMGEAMSVLRNYDPAPDGSRFAIIKQPRARGGPQFIVVENWFEELKARVPAGK